MADILVTTRHSNRLRRERSGAILPLLAVGMLVIVILAAFAINIAYLELTRTEMYIASDAASRAAGREFMISNSMDDAKVRARLAAELNPIGGKSLKLADGDFVFGQATRDSLSTRYTFRPGGDRPNAVEGDTNIGGGIFAGLQSFALSQSRPYASRVIIVLTDGIDTVGSNPVFAAEEAARQKTMVFAITFSDEADKATMQRVAEKGLGKHYHADNRSSLTEVFRDIARQIPILLSK